MDEGGKWEREEGEGGGEMTGEREQGRLLPLYYFLMDALMSSVCAKNNLPYEGP